VGFLTRRSALLAMGGAAASAGTLAGLPAPALYEDPEKIYSALREQPGTMLRLDGGEIKVVFADGAPGVDRERTLAWIAHAAKAVSRYFGNYPVARFGLLVISEDSDRVGHATTFGYDGAITRIRVGTRSDAAAFAKDWVLVHEMLHTALPNLPRRALWLQEGNATWVEPVARAQIGWITPEEVWREAAQGLPKGEPRATDGGMDGTRSWGRLYWGGATFWLLAEISIYVQSQGRFMLRDALRAINRTSGGNGVVWEPEQMMKVGDEATGTSALASLYRQFADRRVDLNVQTTLARLGVELDGGLRLTDDAPLAALRRRITAAS
jgi:hypothetical protein